MDTQPTAPTPSELPLADLDASNAAQVTGGLNFGPIKFELKAPAQSSDSITIKTGNAS
jgi:hypothetical protein